MKPEHKADKSENAG